MVVDGRRGAGGATGGAGSARGDDGDVEAALGRRDRGLPRSRSGKGEREEWERMGATWGWGLGFQGDKVEWEGPAGPVGWSGGPSACWAEA